MTQNFPPANPSDLWQEIIPQFLARQSAREYVRTVSDAKEAVGYLPNSTLRFWYNNSAISYEAHWHSAYEMIVPIEGSYQVSVGQQVYTLAPGDIFLVPGGELHSLSAPAQGGRFFFLFELDVLNSGYLLSCISQPLLINAETCPPIYEEEMGLLIQLCQDYLENDRLRNEAIYTRLMNFLLNYGKFRLSQEESGAEGQIAPSGQRSYSEKFQAVLVYLDRHYAEDLTLEQVAAVAGFSKFHFSRIFKQFSGQNFYDYLCHRRIKAAEAMLRKRGVSISQIALQSGFSSVSTFNRTFRKLKGCTPTQYRGMSHLHFESIQGG